MHSIKSNGADQSDFDEKCRFIETLVKAWQIYGVSSHAMLDSLSRVVRALGLHGEFVATPSHVHTVLWGEEEHEQQVHLVVSKSGNFELGKFERVKKLADQVETGAVTPSEGLARLQEIMEAPSSYRQSTIALAFVLCGASFAAILGAGWLDALFGGAISLVSYAATRAAVRSAGIAPLHEILAAMIAAFLSMTAAAIVPGMRPVAVIACAIIWFVPGFGLTIAPLEMIMGHTLSGLIWFSNALVVEFKLVGGAAVGVMLARGLGISSAPGQSHAAIAPIWTWVAIPVLVIAYAIIMRADRRALGGIAFGGLLVWGTRELGSLLGFWQGTFFGSAVLAMYSSLYANWFGAPLAVTLLPCVMILLPGLDAMSALRAADAQGVVAGLQSAYGVAIIIVVIIGGSITGGVLEVHNVQKTLRTLRSMIERTPRS